MLEENIQSLNQKLKEQIDLAREQTTLGGIYNSMYFFVEIIENNPLIFKLIRIKVQEEWDVEDGIKKLYESKEIDDKEFTNLMSIHVFVKFWYKSYSLLKTAHDFIMLDKWHIAGERNTDWALKTLDLFLFINADQDFSKQLTKDEIEVFVSRFEECLDSLNELINSNQKLLDKLDLELNGSSIKNDSIVEIELNQNTKCTYNKIDKEVYIKHDGKSISFSGRTALILLYFCDNTDKENLTHKTFKDWLNSRNIEDEKLNSINFRNSITKINVRINHETAYLRLLIKQMDKNEDKPTEINYYKFEIIKK